MYIEAYRLILTLSSLVVLMLIGSLGYLLGGVVGAVIAAGLPSIFVFKFLYLQ